MSQFKQGVAPRMLLLNTYHAALDAVNGRDRVAAALSNQPLDGEVYVVAIGKAAATMMQGAVDELGSQLRSCLLITKYGHMDETVFRHIRLHVIEAGHPLPDEKSLMAGKQLISFLEGMPTTASVLFLISGGASSLVDVPVDGLGLHELRRINTWLLSSGLAIGPVNSIRKRFSKIKAGKLIKHVRARQARVLLMSDVPNNSVADIGSGLLVRNDDGDVSVPDAPSWLAEYLRVCTKPEALEKHQWTKISIEIIASIDDACRAAVNYANQQGFIVKRHDTLICGDTERSGKMLAQQLLNGSPGVHVWGGETTIKLPSKPGRGGRNQSFALAAACEIAERDNIYILAAATDGTDGPTNYIGAIVDGGTMQRGALQGFDAKTSLNEADAGTFLAASGDLLQTGPTGTNVMDLMLGLKTESH